MIKKNAIATIVVFCILNVEVCVMQTWSFARYCHKYRGIISTHFKVS